MCGKGGWERNSEGLGETRRDGRGGRGGRGGVRAARAGCGIAPDSLTRQLPITPKGDKLEKRCELCGLGGILREKLGGTRAVGELGKERVVVRFGGGGIGWLGELIY